MLSELISGRRQELDMSAADLMRATGLSKAYVHSLEHPGQGKRERQPTAGVLIKLARALRLPISVVFRAAGIDVADMPMPLDPRVGQLIELVEKDNRLSRLVGVWTALSAEDQETITQAAEDLGKLREYLAEVKRASNDG